MDYERHIYKIFLPVLDYESIRLYLSYKFPYEKQEVLRHIISSAVIIVREKIHYEQEIKKNNRTLLFCELLSQFTEN